jgi:hypothetical protein
MGDDANTEGGGSSFGTTDDDVGMGCYNLDTNRCSCDPSVCNEGLCIDSGGRFTDACRSCSCESIMPDPTQEPSPKPSPEPTSEPTKDPTKDPTRDPTPGPTAQPTPEPSPEPTRDPTPGPTLDPSPFPTNAPTPNPTRFPTRFPTREPTRFPTRSPTRSPTREPTPAPQESESASEESVSESSSSSEDAQPDPTPFPTENPTRKPTLFPTENPTKRPTRFPTAGPTQGPQSQSVAQAQTNDSKDKVTSQNENNSVFSRPAVVSMIMEGAFGDEPAVPGLNLTNSPVMFKEYYNENRIGIETCAVSDTYGTVEIHEMNVLHSGVFCVKQAFTEEFVDAEDRSPTIEYMKLEYDCEKNNNDTVSIVSAYCYNDDQCVNCDNPVEYRVKYDQFYYNDDKVKNTTSTRNTTVLAIDSVNETCHEMVYVDETYGLGSFEFEAESKLEVANFIRYSRYISDHSCVISKLDNNITSILNQTNVPGKEEEPVFISMEKRGKRNAKIEALVGGNLRRR